MNANLLKTLVFASKQFLYLFILQVAVLRELPAGPMTNRASKEMRNLRFDKGNNNISTSPTKKQMGSPKKIPRPNRKIKGKIADVETGESLIGATIKVEGSTIGTITDVEGNFSLSVPDDAQTLIVSFTGFKSVELTLGSQTVFDIRLEPDVSKLDEVVVTALGVKRETKALGYAVQKIGGSELAKAKETNVVNSLSGKIAGLQVTGGNSGVGSSSLITIRGEGSLIPGQNSPLFVVDGIPINNNVVSNSEEGNLEVDYGNGAQDINPDDIETLTVLKGPNATALYGSRGSNGVILITTKSGRQGNGIGISYTNSTTFEHYLRLPKYQNRYGQGANGEFGFGDGGLNRQSTGGLNDHVDESWGPRLDGRPVAQHDSPTSGGLRAGDVYARPRNNEGVFTDTVTPTPWIARPDNIADFFRTGSTVSHHLSLTGGGENGSIRVSITDLKSKGILPNTDFNRRTYALKGSYRLADRLTVSSSMNYIDSHSGNRPNNSYGTENVMYLWAWFGRQIDMNSLKNYWQPGFTGVRQYNYNYNYHDNPYFTMFENTNSFNRDRVIANVKADFQMTDHLSLMLRTGLDFSNELRESRRAFSTQRFKKGQYRTDLVYFKEQNTDFLLSYNKEISSNFTVGTSFGGNYRTQEDRYKRESANSLSVPGIYNLQNAAEPLAKTQHNAKKAVGSVYAFANVSYRNMLFLDVTGRNDWSSTLPLSKDYSYFYPSVGLSAVVSDMLKLPRSVSFLKVRAGWAIVGNDTNPYNLIGTFNFSESFNGAPRVTFPETLKNSNLKPEESNSIEVGADLRMFEGRIGLDLAMYKSNVKNQILTLPVTVGSGYRSRVINAGEVENKGLEITLVATPYKSGKFQWDTNINFTTNRGKVESLTDHIDTYVVSEKYLQVVAKEGGRIGDVYGTGFKTVEDPNSPHFGKEILENGLPVRSNTLKKLGNYNPDFMVGFQHSFSYKNLRLSFLFDWREGGVIHSRTVAIGGTSGMLDFTLPGRETGIVADGVIATGDGSYRQNDVKVTASSYYATRYKRQNEESSMFDASYVKWREVKLTYTLPSSFLKSTRIRSASVSLIGRNLALWTGNNHFDPESISFNGNTIVPGHEDMSTPSSRSMGFHLDIRF